MNEKKLNEYLNKIGRECFVKYYEIFSNYSNDTLSRANASELLARGISSEKKKYTDNSINTRLSKSKSIIKDGYTPQALEIIIKSQRLDSAIIKKAQDLLNPKQDIILSSNANTPMYQNGVEGIVKEEIYLRKSRDHKLVEERKKIDNCTCQTCGYRKKIAPNKFIIDVHHLNPVGQMKDISITNINDLICLCPNCHRIAHTNKNKPYTVQEIKEKILRETSVPSVSSVVKKQN